MKLLQHTSLRSSSKIHVTVACLFFAAGIQTKADENNVMDGRSKLASAYQKMREAKMQHTVSQRSHTRSWAEAKIATSEYVDSLIEHYMGSDSAAIQRAYKRRPTKLPFVAANTSQDEAKLAHLQRTISPQLRTVSTKLSPLGAVKNENAKTTSVVPDLTTKHTPLRIKTAPATAKPSTNATRPRPKRLPIVAKTDA